MQLAGVVSISILTPSRSRKKTLRALPDATAPLTISATRIAHTKSPTMAKNILSHTKAFRDRSEGGIAPRFQRIFFLLQFLPNYLLVFSLLDTFASYGLYSKPPPIQ